MCSPPAPSARGPAGSSAATSPAERGLARHGRRHPRRGRGDHHRIRPFGLGFPPDFPTWGRLLYDGLQYMQVYPERVVWPGLAISLTVLSVNYIGDGLRDALDPRIRGR